MMYLITLDDPDNPKVGASNVIPPVKNLKRETYCLARNLPQRRKRNGNFIFKFIMIMMTIDLNKIIRVNILNIRNLISINTSIIKKLIRNMQRSMMRRQRSRGIMRKRVRRNRNRQSVVLVSHASLSKHMLNLFKSKEDFL